MSLEASAPPMIEGNTVGAVPPGEMLRAAREQAGLSQEDIAGKLKLAARQIAAIETGDWASLPERTFTRGFMRSYARIVGIDPTSLGLELATAQSAPTAEIRSSPSEAMNEVTFDPSGKSRSPARWIVPALLVAALIGGVAYFQGAHLASLLPVKFGGTTPPPTLKTAVAAQAEQAAAAKQAEAATATATNAPGSSGSVIGAPAPAAQSPATEGAPTAATGGAMLSPAPTATGVVSPPVSNPDAPVSAAAAPLLGERRVSFTFKGKSWTEVRSKGEVIFSENAQPGTREFSGAPPLSFAVGNASNVMLLIDGKPFDMANVTRNDVARFRIE